MLSRLIPRLEAGGLIRRHQGDADRRVRYIRATDKGNRLLERIRSERTDALSRRLSNLEASKRTALATALPILEDLAESLLDRDPPVTNSRR